jgi:hypothetical protein
MRTVESPAFRRYQEFLDPKAPTFSRTTSTRELRLPFLKGKESFVQRLEEQIWSGGFVSLTSWTYGAPSAGRISWVQRSTWKEAIGKRKKETEETVSDAIY